MGAKAYDTQFKTVYKRVLIETNRKMIYEAFVGMYWSKEENNSSEESIGFVPVLRPDERIELYASDIQKITILDENTFFFFKRYRSICSFIFGMFSLCQI